MTRVYLTVQGSTAHKRGGVLVVEQQGTTLLRAPLAQVEHVVVVGKGIQLSTALLTDLLQRGIEIAYVSRGGRYYGQASGAPPDGILLRMAQHAYIGDPTNAARFVRGALSSKLDAQRIHLMRRGAPPPAIQRLQHIAADVPRASTIDQARGFEGAAAALYWQSLVPFVPVAWRFAGRRHHPAPDPLNALLSFAYTLLVQELTTALRLAGLDPQLGALHTPRSGRPSLALDMEEPLRPLGVDIWVVDAVLRGDFRPADFEPDGPRVLLAAEARRRFLAAYERAMARRVQHPLAPGRVTVRQAVELEVRQVAQLFTGDRQRVEPIVWP